MWIALVSGGASFTGYTWIPIVAPLLGGMAGALIYDFTIAKVLIAKGIIKSDAAATGGESLQEPAAVE